MKPGEQRHAGDMENARLRIGPGTDAGLEHFHDGADDMIDEEPEKQHACLDRERHQKQEVVARQSGTAQITQIRTDDQCHHGAAEQTGPGLLHAKADELVGKGGCRALRRPARQQRLAGSERRGRRPLGRGTGGRSNGPEIVQGGKPEARLPPAWRETWFEKARTTA
jgi:hypothetical protein